MRWTALFRGFWNILEALTLALGPLPPLALVLSALIPAMLPLLSTSQARVRTQNNVSSQFNIIPTSLANSPLPIAEAPLSKFA